ncbi:MAG: DUF4012 domain-containing protein [Patescibacteria group bacterium]
MSDIRRTFGEVPVRPEPVFHQPESFERQSPHYREFPVYVEAENPVPPVFPKKQYHRHHRRKPSAFLKGILFVLFLIVVCLFGWWILEKGKNLGSSVQTKGEMGYSSLVAALDNLEQSKYQGSLEHFHKAEEAFAEADKELALWNSSLTDIVRFVPGLSRAASGKYILEAGEHFARAGVPLSEVAKSIDVSKGAYKDGEKISLLNFLQDVKVPLAEAESELTAANSALQKVALDDIPKEKREQFLLVRNHLPLLVGLMQGFSENEILLEELLGGNGPRKYLFLFQNNHEMRATGGFIGSYGMLDIHQGVVRKFFIDGIFNPDGQLKENIIPPKPLQKVSAGWSLHDSNWFPDFPVSAEKAIFFYEKTGGPTVDGVIVITPAVLQKLLMITGPITLPQYGLVVDADNFIPVIQEQVEVKYDKEENKPKAVLADLAAVLIERVFSLQDKTTLYKMAEALVEGLNERHIQLYARHEDTEELIDKAGWSGKMLETGYDYLSVIHTNINGYKTDGVIDETVKHRSEIQSDGSIIDTVTITRKHNGGDTEYDWWNKVNADYLRVYVPKGSQLLSAKGATWEFPEAPLDYKALGFREDADVVREEENTKIDEATGTRISEDAGKTVFGAWVYVSPQESVTVEYRYKLPFVLDQQKLSEGGSAYSVLYQKQAGSPGSTILAEIVYPEGWKTIWQTGGNLIPYERVLRLEGTLKTDKFVGAVFSTRQ